MIADDPFNGLREDALNILSLQRCGTDTSWWAGALGHGACHTSPAKIYGSDQTIDVSGGWHDAGDYGRYMKTGAKAVSDLLFAYMYDPDSFTDERGPEAGNGFLISLMKPVMNWNGCSRCRALTAVSTIQP